LCLRGKTEINYARGRGRGGKQKLIMCVKGRRGRGDKNQLYKQGGEGECSSELH
jgi:hypothetical protein